MTMLNGGRLRPVDLGSQWALPVITILGCAVFLWAGLALFGHRMLVRSEVALGRTTEVEQIWGGPLLQPQPTIGWRRADAATPELSVAELSATRVEVDLDVEYRRRGLTEYPGYQAEVAAVYELDNPVADPIQAAFSIGLPSGRSALMLTDLSLTIDGQEEPSHTEYAADRIVWTGRVGGGKKAIFALHYRARGLSRFGYSLAPNDAAKADARPISHFELAMRVRGAHDDLDFPLGSMTPTLSETTPEGDRRLVWSVDRVLSAFDVGLVVPDRAGRTAALGKLVSNAVWFYLLYAFSVLWVLAACAPKARALHLAGLSAAYFLYFPLATYLVAYLPWFWAAGLATFGISILAIGHGRRFVGPSAALGIGICQVLFLAVPAAAYLIPSHTGIILVTAGFVAVAFGLAQIGRWAERSTGPAALGEVVTP